MVPAVGGGSIGAGEPSTHIQRGSSVPYGTCRRSMPNSSMLANFALLSRDGLEDLPVPAEMPLKRWHQRTRGSFGVLWCSHAHVAMRPASEKRKNPVRLREDC